MLLPGNMDIGASTVHLPEQHEKSPSEEHPSDFLSESYKVRSPTDEDQQKNVIEVETTTDECCAEPSYHSRTGLDQTESDAQSSVAAGNVAIDSCKDRMSKASSADVSYTSGAQSSQPSFPLMPLSKGFQLTLKKAIKRFESVVDKFLTK